MSKKKGEKESQMISVRLPIEDYENFKRLSHLEYSQMATIARGLILEWMRKKQAKSK